LKPSGDDQACQTATCPFANSMSATNGFEMALGGNDTKFSNEVFIHVLS